MSTGEASSDWWSEFDFGQEANTAEIKFEADDPILRTIFSNWGEIQKTRKFIPAIFNRKKVNFNIYFGIDSNSLDFEARTEQLTDVHSFGISSSAAGFGTRWEKPQDFHTFSIGYFWGGDIIVFPEVFGVTDASENDMTEAMQLVRQYALESQERKIQEFHGPKENGTTYLSWTDYTHPLVERLQREMHEVLQGPILDDILYRYSKNVDYEWRISLSDEQQLQFYAEEDSIMKDRPLPVYADEYTRADVSLQVLKPTISEPNRPYVEDGVAILRVRGAYKLVEISPGNYVKDRQPAFTIELAKRQPVVFVEKSFGFTEDDYMLPDFDEYGFKITHDAVARDSLGLIIELAQKVRDVEALFQDEYGLEFSKESLGPRIKPGYKYPEFE